VTLFLHFVMRGYSDSTVTRTGAVIGTPTYMAPEQAFAARKLTTAVDVYALGVMLYEMLSGEVPFTGETPVEVLMAHVNQAPPPLPEGLGVPLALRSLLDRMLDKRPEQRPTAAQVAQEMDRMRLREAARALLQEEAEVQEAPAAPVHAAVPRRSQPEAADAGAGEAIPESLEFARATRPAWRWIAAGVAAVCAVVILVAVLSSGRGPVSPAHELEPDPRVQPAAASRPPDPEAAVRPAAAVVAASAVEVTPEPLSEVVAAPLVEVAPEAVPEVLTPRVAEVREVALEPGPVPVEVKSLSAPAIAPKGPPKTAPVPSRVKPIHVKTAKPVDDYGSPF
jgi:serine/threonine-protein kinase